MSGTRLPPLSVVARVAGRILDRPFGWKAETATVRQQSASAFAGDIGISSPMSRVTSETGNPLKTLPLSVELAGLIPLASMPIYLQEAPDPVLDLVTFYSEKSAVACARGSALEMIQEQVLKRPRSCSIAQLRSCIHPNS